GPILDREQDQHDPHPAGPATRFDEAREVVLIERRLKSEINHPGHDWPPRHSPQRVAGGPLLWRQRNDNEKEQSDKDLRHSSRSSAHQLPTDTRQTPSDLAFVIERWAELPEAVRAGIVAMVRASGKREG